MKELPETWFVKMYPEVKRWIRDVLDYHIYDSESEDSYWHKFYKYDKGMPISKKEYINDDQVELTRIEFIELVLQDTYKNVMQLNFISKENSKSDTNNYVENNYRDPYGYNFLKSRIG